MGIAGAADELDELRERAYGPDARGLTGEELRRLADLEASASLEVLAAEAPDAAEPDAAEYGEEADPGGDAAEPEPEAEPGAPARGTRGRRRRGIAAAAGILLLAAGVGGGYVWGAVAATPAAADPAFPEFALGQTEEDPPPVVIEGVDVDLTTVRYIATIDGIELRLVRKMLGSVCLLSTERVSENWAVTCGGSGRGSLMTRVGSATVAVGDVPPEATELSRLSPSVAIVSMP